MRDSGLCPKLFAVSAVLHLDHVTKYYGDFKAVDDVSLSLPAGSIYGFLGPNGAGKTTTIRMILEIIRPTSGTITVLGSSSALAVRQRIGYLPEEKGLYKKMTAWAVIAHFATLKGMTRRAAKLRAFELLERYGLPGFAKHRTEALSKGMQQKVQMLAAIAHQPEFVILDEPFVGLDPVNQEVMEQMIRDLAARGGTVLFSTHVMQHAERLCDRLLLLARGRKLFDGTLAEARRTLPRRVEIETEDDITPLRDLPEVRAIANGSHPTAGGSSGNPGSAQRWDIQLAEQADPQAVLQACFTHGIRLRRFQQTDPTLHDIFMHLVGAQGSTAEGQ